MYFYETYYFFRIYLVGEQNQKKGLSVKKEDYERIKEGTCIKITYYDSVNIPIEGVYNNISLKDFSFFEIKKNSLLQK